MQHTGSFAFIKYKDKWLFLLRDNNPEISSPNCWSLVGGGVEEGETPEQTLARELKEEANITLKDYKLLFIAKEQKRYIYYILLDDLDVKNFKLGNEGQRLEFFTWKEAEKLNLAKSLRKYFPRYEKMLKVGGYTPGV